MIDLADLYEALALLRFEERVVWARPENVEEVRTMVHNLNAEHWITVEPHPYLPASTVVVVRRVTRDAWERGIAPSRGFLMGVDQEPRPRL